MNKQAPGATCNMAQARLIIAQAVLARYELGDDFAHRRISHLSWNTENQQHLHCFLETSCTGTEVPLRNSGRINLDFHVKFNSAGSVIAAYAQDMRGNVVGRRGDGDVRRPDGTVQDVSDAEVEAAKAAGFRIEFCPPDVVDELLRGRYWWTVTQPHWSGIESSEGDFSTEQEAWADAVRTLQRDPEMRGVASVDVVIPARDPKFASEPTYTAKMRVARLKQAMKAWRVADESSDDASSDTEPDTLAVSSLLADLRHYCDAYGLDFSAMDRGGYADYCDQLSNDRHHEVLNQASSPQS
ncbi:TPA: hypothetical protein ACK3Q6_007017 [Burkholderia cepacia]|jgi:hypothetical protein|uniref:Uncharacterized protein n=5 Tax=Burkholderia cepacia complex TaxID=87882 RepID=A0A286P6L4_9BURK|nr:MULTISPECIES: hypothetical protein [Burkholderia]HDR9760276.1 hypothetical protein [Burkholderia cepacia ATCC 25416]HDV6369476.1 hypothetical protein [Burkholderia cepacia]MBX3822984.1 hypothetical protein [Burkholderia contaminans]MBX3843025.1 hypothetical protein [Burkholderia contaminans]MBX3860927.1 hypothetical protein [Burkholderia contaminans]